MPALLALAAAAACQAASAVPPADSARPPCDGQVAEWRQRATGFDRYRLRNWRRQWDAAVTPARATDARAIAAEGALFDPDRALDAPLPPAGAYRCRTFKLGPREADDRRFSVSAPVACVVEKEGDKVRLTVTEGMQRPTGRLYEGAPGRGIFLGSMVFGDERRPLAYGADRQRDMIGYVDRVADRRWRIILPSPGFESLTDVMEIAG